MKTMILVPDRLGVPVLALRAVDSLPDIPLLAAPSLRTQRQLHVICLLTRAPHHPEKVPGRWLHNLAKSLAVGEVSVAVLVDVGQAVGAKVHRVRARSKASVERIGVPTAAVHSQ